MPIDVSQFHQVFFEESFEGLDTMEEELLAITPGQVEADSINAIFRGAHTIKGGAATFGFDDIATFSHQLETLLDQVRSGSRELDVPMVELMLRAVDLLRTMIDGAGSGKGSDKEAVATFTTRLNQALNDESSATVVPSPPQITQPPESMAQAKQKSVEGWQIHFRPDPAIFAHGNDVALLFRELAELGDLEVTADLSRLPSLAELDAEQCHISWRLALHGLIEKEAVEAIFEWVADESEIVINPLASLIEAMPAAAVETGSQPSEVRAQEAPRRVAAERTDSIRVNIEKVDALVDLVGELVITQSMLSQLEGLLKGSAADQFNEGLNQLEQHTRNLQDCVMRMRMLPIAFVFNRFPRMVRDLATALGKQVTLEMDGETTEIDKTVMETIGDPLMHLVRNAIDHGLEEPQSRRAAGKPESCMLSLSAYHQGGNIYVEVRDDGRGIDPERIIGHAREKGLLAEEATVAAEAAWELLFLPGFSTATEVSDVSGRGVGLDVVNRNVRALGGTIMVSSEPGRGTTFTIRLPLTLAVLDGQLIRVGDDVYIIPLEAIVESIQLDNKCLSAVEHWLELYSLRDEYIPIIHLARLFHKKEAVSHRPLVVIVEYEGRHVGLAVDQLLNQQQVVIKSLESNFWKVEGVSAATILGDGTVGLILDVGGLIHLADHKQREYSDPESPAINSQWMLP
ncbi:MAG: chemotaxis protein CheA [Candidatus Sedimenticola sp. (ex Thyasira tokunagai)]